MDIVPLGVWYPAMAAKWDGDPVPWSAREAWVHHHTAGGVGSDPLRYARSVADGHWAKWGVPGGYNFLIGLDGVIREMCGYDNEGVHAGSHEWNRVGVAVCFQGDYRVKAPSEVMLDAARELIASRPLPQTTHRAVRPTPTTCPGAALAALIPLELEDDMPSPKDWTAEDWAAFGSGYNNVIVKHTDLNVGWHLRNIWLGVKRTFTNLEEWDDDELAAIAKAVNDELARRQQA